MIAVIALYLAIGGLVCLWCLPFLALRNARGGAYVFIVVLWPWLITRAIAGIRR